MTIQAHQSLRIREIFHVEFLRHFSRKVKPACYALKGGINLRLFFNSIRYSEDMDLDVRTIGVAELGDVTMKILGSAAFLNEIKPFGIDRVVLPDMSKAKQTETTQRFKLHLITDGNEDFFTKIEFSRRKTAEKPVTEPVPDKALRMYRMSPFVVSHYGVRTAIEQKINALVHRSAVQARDIFDLYILSPQYLKDKDGDLEIGKDTANKACENLLPVSFNQFRDTVLGYFPEEDRRVYDDEKIWEDIRLKASDLICRNQPS